MFFLFVSFLRNTFQNDTYVSLNSSLETTELWQSDSQLFYSVRKSNLVYFKGYKLVELHILTVNVYQIGLENNVYNQEGRGSQSKVIDPKSLLKKNPRG